jgi:hypothetical protein
VENNVLSDIESSEYLLSGNSGIIIRGQQFDDALISGEGIDADEDVVVDDEADEADDDQPTENIVEIVGSGTIEVTDGANDEEEDDGDGDDDDDDGDEANSYNTDIEPYTTILGDGDTITVNSS